MHTDDAGEFYLYFFYIRLSRIGTVSVRYRSGGAGGPEAEAGGSGEARADQRTQDTARVGRARRARRGAGSARRARAAESRKQMRYYVKITFQPHAAPHTSQGTAHRAARCTLRPARLVFAPRQATSRRRARLRLYDRGLGCCRAEAGARLALGSGGGAASLRLMSFRLPCSESKRDEGRCGARKEWWRPAPITMAMLARTRPCLLWLDLLW